MKRSLALILMLLMVLSMTTACGGTKAEVKTDADGASASVPGAQPESSNAGPTAAVVKDTLTVAIKADVTTFHPSDISTTVEMDVTDQIYDKLMDFSNEGNGEYVPRIAKSYEISEDGLVYTFHLRDDVTFHDGSKLTAEDVKFSAELYQNSKFQGALAEGLSEIEVIDATTIAFKTAEPYSPFLENIIGIHIASKAYHDAVDENAFTSKPIGSGAYKVSSHELGSRIVLEAYEGYYEGVARIKEVTFKVLSDDTTVAIALQTGEIDFASISESNYANLEGIDEIVVESVPMSRFGFISLNHEKSPYSEVKFRQAVAYAINRDNLIELAMDGFGTVNSNILSPMRFGYSEDQFQYTYDPEKAKQLLSEAGIKTPYDLGVMYVADSYSTHAQVIQSDLAAVGLNVTLEILEFNAYLDKLMNGECGITMLSMSLEGSTQQYAMAFKSEYVGAANNVRYVNPEIDTLFDTAAKEIDSDKRYKLYNEIFTKVQDEAVYVVLYNSIGLYAHQIDLRCHPFILEGRIRIYDFEWLK
ncbi:ABC transporter substrate-binding protein [Fusibacter sp. 3D3]|uniref:ABC transporter substrate-binding protein n=1 Tax=Fusibacter sp. 3D3 TaxID=1048380 RepID=UPI000852A6E8|nr:ABC transporter substrate-binding protein [Fusibacter sp. 3D3]GAU79789.1 oligopeptide ABC transporter periplasmic oligopeptide-binding protein OppA [Fusibacter sp. 3D3]